MVRGAPKSSEWSKPTIILAVLSLAANTGWIAYGISAKAKQDVEDRLRAVEIIAATNGARLNALERIR